MDNQRFDMKIAVYVSLPEKLLVHCESLQDWQKFSMIIVEV